jgi:predicted dehydrogenase
MKKITMSILGFGQRGKVFAHVTKPFHEQVELVAVCEKDIEKHDDIQHNYGVPKRHIYTDFNKFIEQGKLSDFLVISTMDQDHYNHAIAALNAGYHLLLEKPIALTKEHIESIKDTANELNLRVSIAHVLRYTPFYMKIKSLITEGHLGQIATLSQTEHVGYFHYAHSFVRGNWHNSRQSAPMILAKSCHDLDIIKWLIDQRCKHISSFGNLMYFNENNAPKGSAKHCYQCTVECPYHAIDFYSKNPNWMALFTDKTDAKAVLSNEHINYGKCVYRMDNDVVDHQVVNMEFEFGTTASFVMTAFSNETRRTIKIHGTKAELEAELDSGLIKLMPYGKETLYFNINQMEEDLSYHSGGDKKLIMDFIHVLANPNHAPLLTDINYAVESHFMALNAEQSRLKSGEVIDLEKEWHRYGKTI